MPQPAPNPPACASCRHSAHDTHALALPYPTICNRPMFNLLSGNTGPFGGECLEERILSKHPRSCGYDAQFYEPRPAFPDYAAATRAVA
jgi:hypothetical protein